MHAKGKIQRNNYTDGQRGRSFAGKTSLVPLIASTHAQKYWEVALTLMLSSGNAPGVRRVLKVSFYISVRDEK